MLLSVGVRGKGTKTTGSFQKVRNKSHGCGHSAETLESPGLNTMTHHSAKTRRSSQCSAATQSNGRGHSK